MKVQQHVRPWIILFAYLGIALLMTLPLGLRFGTHLPDGMDTLVHYWNDWWVGYALRNGQPLYHTSHMFYPQGITLVYHNISWVHIFPWLALEPLIGGIAAYNAIFVLYLALCGCAFFALACEFTGDRRVAFVAGLIYQCWPHRLTHPSHPNYMSTWPIPLFVLFLLRAIRYRRWRDGVLAGVFLLLAGYTCLQFLIPIALVSGVYLLLILARLWNRRAILVLLLAGGVAAAGLAPMILVMVRGWRDTPADLIIESEEITMQTDLLAYVTPHGGHPLFGQLTRPAYERYYPDRGSRRSFSPYLGGITLCLAVLGACTARRRAAFPWAIIALALAWLALGPVLRANGQFYGQVPMLYSLASRLFLVRLIREPDRFNLFVALPVSILSAYGIRYLLRRLAGGRRRASAALVCLIGALILFDYLVVPLPLQSGQLSPGYAALAAESGNFSVLNVPVNPYRSKPYMFAQTVHRRPILQGHSSRYPQDAFQTLDGQPWLSSLRRFDDIPPRQRDVSRQLAPLAQDGVRYLVVHKDMMDASRWFKWQRYLAVTPWFEDQDIAIYAMAPQAGQEFDVRERFGVIRTAVPAGCHPLGLPLEVDVAWGTAAPPDRDLSVRLALVSEMGIEVLAPVFPIFPGWPTSQWPANAVVWGSYTLDTRSVSAPGAVSIALTVVDAETGAPLEPAVPIGRIALRSAPCPAPALPESVLPTGARFGDALQLIGYRSIQGADVLAVTLHWQSVIRMDTDYKVFVHLFDPTTGVPVAQDDAMPMQWRYPTTFWDPGERVTDPIFISLEDVPPGSYGLAVGVYDPATMKRLPVVDRMGLLQTDGRLVLQGEGVRTGAYVP